MKVFMTEVVITLTKLESGEWPRLVYSSDRNIFLTHNMYLQSTAATAAEECNWTQFVKCTNFTVEEDYCAEGSSEDEDQDFEIGDCHFLYDQI